jgi:hypothetical protein
MRQCTHTWLLSTQKRDQAKHEPWSARKTPSVQRCQIVPTEMQRTPVQVEEVDVVGGTHPAAENAWRDQAKHKPSLECA